MEYTTATKIQDRLTAAGYKFVADRDGDGSVSAGEIASYITTAISYAGNVIDGMIGVRYSTSDARASGNSWLDDRCVDIAAYRAATHGGRKSPKSLRDDYDVAIDMLRAVRDDGSIVPGLTLPSTAGGGTKSPSIPRWINVK